MQVGKGLGLKEAWGRVYSNAGILTHPVPCLFKLDCGYKNTMETYKE